MRCVFWASLAMIAYTYVGYPLWLYVASRWRPRSVRSASIFPSVSVIIAVHNEAQVLPRKLCNLAEVNYPSDRYEIVVVSDGSTDSTNQLLAAHAHKNLRVFFSPQHEGKAAALNRGTQAARGEILAFTDARQMIEPDAIGHLVANFADPSVGCVSGELILSDPTGAPSLDGPGLYWSMEKKIRQWESAKGSVIGATGALYAVRRDLVVSLPAGTILDDVYIPLHVVRQGARVVFEPRARAWDSVAATLRQEFRRKVRTLTGNYQLLHLEPWLWTSANPVRFEFASHKLLRLLVPFAVAGVFVSSLFLQGPAYELAVVVQAVFYALAALAIFRPKLGIVSRLADMALTFVVLNTAAVVALIFFLTGKKEVWAR